MEEWSLALIHLCRLGGEEESEKWDSGAGALEAGDGGGRGGLELDGTAELWGSARTQGSLLNHALQEQ